MRTHTSLVSIERLRKTYGAVTALHDINLNIEAGHIIGLIGPNSGGKSSLLKHIVGICLPDSGSCKTLGIEAGNLSAADFRRIGYVHQEGELLHWLSTAQMIRYVEGHYATWNKDLESRLVEYFELDLKAKVGKLSPGQRQKLSILLAVCFEPELLILDEPASALDPIARQKFLSLLLEIIQDQDRTIIISSHVLSDIEKVMDRVLLLNDGKLLRDCSFDALLETFVKFELTVSEGELPEDLHLSRVLSCERDSHRAVIISERGAEDLIELARGLSCQIDYHALSLEEIYPLILSQGGNCSGEQ